MALDLERFWAVIRRPSRRQPAHQPRKRQIFVWIEGFDSYGEPCTRRLQVPLTVGTNNNLTCEPSFDGFTRDLTIVGFKMYLQPKARDFSYIECTPRNINAGDSVKLNLSIVDNVELKQRILR